MTTAERRSTTRTTTSRTWKTYTRTNSARSTGVEWEEDDGGLPTGQLAVAGVAIGIVALLGGVLVLSIGGGGGGEVGAAGSAHYHGTIQMNVLGDRVDFTQDQYQLQDDRFHFEGDGRWHAHATGVTLGYGMESLGIGVTDSSVRFQGTNYTEADGYAISVTVNGDTVSPGYTLQDGDTVRIAVEES
ncbi:hypothetical protein ACFQL1_07525 [Halomicroarcula sp. GCM10025709]|uniref:hypothetical protein n=1 Tax=Halomicroarcula sp. GCM10025709 TaxID=3252669 RepID=UPI003609E978